MKLEKAVEAKESALPKKEIRKAYNRWWWTEIVSRSYDRAHAVGFCNGMSDILAKLYTKKEDLSAALKRHLVFFNTMGTWGGAILGLSIGMEQEKAAGNDIPGETIVSLKTGLMGPLASLGDSINLATFRVLFYSLAASVGATGNPFAVIIPLIYTVLDWYFGLFMTQMGYRLGLRSITSMLQSGVIDKVIKAAGILGLFMVGALTANNVKFALLPTFIQGGAETSVQSVIDGVFPGFLPMAAVWGCFFYYKKIGTKFGRLILGILVGCMLLALVGIV